MFQAYVHQMEPIFAEMVEHVIQMKITTSIVHVLYNLKAYFVNQVSQTLEIINGNILVEKLKMSKIHK